MAFKLRTETFNIILIRQSTHKLLPNRPVTEIPVSVTLVEIGLIFVNVAEHIHLIFKLFLQTDLLLKVYFQTGEMFPSFSKIVDMGRSLMYHLL